MFNLFSPAPQSTADDFCFKWAQGELEDSEFMKIALGGGGEAILLLGPLDGQGVPGRGV
jgi:hypothetical protein